MALSSVRNCPSSWRVLYPAVLSRRPGSELPTESVCANLRCIEAGFVDLCRLIYHGHHCIRNKILRWGPVKKKDKEIILFSSTSPAVSRLHQSLKTPENNPSSQQCRGPQTEGYEEKQITVAISTLCYKVYIQTKNITAFLVSAHLPTYQWRP